MGVAGGGKLGSWEADEHQTRQAPYAVFRLPVTPGSGVNQPWKVPDHVTQDVYGRALGKQPGGRRHGGVSSSGVA